MQGFYGFKDASGEWFLIIDTDRCTGCGKCVDVCPAQVLELQSDELDPLSDAIVITVKEDKRNKIKYACAPCKPGYGETLPPCIAACEPNALSHTEAWKNSHKAT
jgi:NAD-dependent dihydropyrimidine dehydrogenase PreA subunit